MNLTRRWILPACAALLGLGAHAPGLAQSSSSFRLEEHVLNAGGHPEQGAVLSSSGFQVTLGALGEALVASTITGPSYGLAVGFAGANRPPGEVTGLVFLDSQTLSWDAEPSVGSYHLYRGALSTLGGLGFGACQQPGLTQPVAQDTDPVPLNDGHFFLVTAVSRLGEEGIKGRQGSGALRLGSTCP